MVEAAHFLAAYSLILVIFGTAGNLLTCLVCFRLRSTTTFVFLAIAAVFDAASLYFWNLNHFTQTFLDIDLQSKNLNSCRIGQFVQFTSLEISAWLLVLMSVDRLLTISVNSWKRIYSTPKRAALVGGLCCLLLIGLNINVLVLYGFENEIQAENTNTTTKVTFCFPTSDPRSYFMSTWETVS